MKVWDRFWFGLADARAVGLLRVFLVGILLIELPNRIEQFLFQTHSPLFFRSQDLISFSWPYFLSFAHQQAEFLTSLAPIVGYLSLIGLATRPALVLFTFCHLVFFASDSSFGFHDHGPSLVIQVLLVLCLSPGLESLSVSQFFRKRSPALVSRWSIQLISSLLVLIFFTAGASKLRLGGLEWTNGETLGFYLSGASNSNIEQFYVGPEHVGEVDQFRDGIGLTSYVYGAGKTQLGEFLAESPIILQAMAISTLLLELGFVLILVPGRHRVTLLMIAASFHLGVWITMKISAFTPWIGIELALAAIFYLRMDDKSGKEASRPEF